MSFFTFGRAAAMPSYAEAKQATLKATGYTGSTTLTDFQALVKLSASNDAYGFSYAEAGGSTATNIWFTDAGGTLIPHDIDTWNTNGDSFVWVKIPTLTNGTEIVMHWSDSAGDVQTASGNVWTNFVGVWHMNATGKTAEPDKTGHGLNATPLDTNSGAVSFNTETGRVGTGRANSFAYDGRYFSVGSNDSPYHSTITTKANFSVSGWFKLSSIPNGNNYQRMICGLSSGSLNGWELYRNDGTALAVRSGNSSGNKTEYTDYKVSISADGTTWHYITVVWEGQYGTLNENGSLVKTKDLAYSNAHLNNVFTIGGRVGTGNRSFVGTFDEVRMYNGVLSADRVAADYATMNDPTVFLTLVSDNTPVTAAWTGGGNDGDGSNAANWACTNSAGTGVSGLPTGATDVTVSGNGLNIHIPSGSSFLCKSFTLGNCSLAADCDLCGVGTVTIPSGVTVDLKDRALFVQSLAGDGVITNTANGTYTTLDYISTGAGQYIITGYIPAGDDVVSTHVNFNNADCQSIWCSRGGSGTANTFTCITYAAPPFFRFDRNTTAPTGTRILDVATNMHYEIIANYGTGACKVNGTKVYTMGTASYTPGSALSLFRLMNNANGTALTSYETTDYKIYHFRICGADGSPKLDLVPAKNGSNVAGLWDRVSGTFYPSASSDAFNAGAEKGRGELVFHVPSGATATRSGVTIAVGVKVTKEGAGTLAETTLGYNMTQAGDYCLREGAVSFGASTSDYLDLGPTNFCVSGGTFSPSGAFNLQVGRERNGCRFTQKGGTVNLPNGAFVGVRASGTYEISGGTLSAGNSYFGHGKNADGELIVSGGNVTLGLVAIAINDSGSKGGFTMSAGSLTVYGNMQVGYAGTGTFTQSGGTSACNDYLSIGRYSGSHGTYTMTGGTYSSPNRLLIVGENGTGTLDVSGSAVVTAPIGVSIGQSATGNGTVVLHDGGTIKAPSIFGGTGVESVTIDGGTIEATADGNILANIAEVTISAGGLTITNDFAVSITNTTLTVTPGTTAITMTGSELGTLDLSHATVQFASDPSRSFDFAVAQGGGTFTGLPMVTHPWKARLTDGDTRCIISRGGFVILVR